MSRWYVVLNDLIGGWSVGNRDKPQSQYDFRASMATGDRIIADFMDEPDARVVAECLTERDHPDTVPARRAEGG